MSNQTAAQAWLNALTPSQRRTLNNGVRLNMAVLITGVCLEVALIFYGVKAEQPPLGILGLVLLIGFSMRFVVRALNQRLDRALPPRDFQSADPMFRETSN